MSRLAHLGRHLSKPSRTLLERVFPLLRWFKPARERVVPGEFNDAVEREHVVRYMFAKQHCEGMTVADIACGSGYGSEILRQVARRVDGYDREPLCGNFVIDLEKETWSQSYDVIVSFETIEHLANPDLFLRAASETCHTLLISTPIGEFKGYNPHHKQTWELPEFRERLNRWFDYTVYYQNGETISAEAPHNVTFVIALCRPKISARSRSTFAS